MKILKQGKKIVIHSFIIEGNFSDVERFPNMSLRIANTSETKRYFFRGFKNDEIYFIMISTLIRALRDIQNEVLEATWNPNAFKGIEFFDGQLLDLN